MNTDNRALYFMHTQDISRENISFQDSFLPAYTFCIKIFEQKFLEFESTFLSF